MPVLTGAIPAAPLPVNGLDPFLRRLSACFFWFVLAIAVSALAGWLLQAEALKSVLPGLVAMNPLTALLFLFCACAGFLRSFPGKTGRAVSYALSLAVGAASLSRMIGYIWPEANAHLDEKMFSDQLNGNVMAPNTATLFFLSALSLLLAESKAGLLRVLRATAEMTALLFSVVAVLGYIYSIRGLYNVSTFIPMALNTAGAFMLLSLAVLLSRPHRGLILPLLSSETAGGVVARRLLPSVIVVPVLLGMLHLQFRKYEVLYPQTDAAFFVVAAIVIFLWLITVTARVIDQSDQARRRAETELQRMNQNLEAAVLERTQELRRTQERLVAQERLRALGEMSSGIAHDFNNALSPILGYSELLREDPSIFRDTETAMSFVDSIHLAAKDASEIVARMRDFSRRNQEVDRAFAPVDLRRIALETIQLTQPKWKTQTLSRGIHVEMRPELSEATVDGSEAELREVLTNLIFNAVDALERDGSITVRLRQESGRITLEVQDTGAGMPEEVRRKCFEPFFSTKGEGGSGLGLSMVYGIVNRHGGTMDIASAPSRGTTFTITFPEGHLTGGARASAPKASTRPLRILFVEDDAAVRRVISRYLSQDGHQVEMAANGRLGLARAGSEPFDLVISDFAMPVMNGIEMASKIRQIRLEVPIILLTGSSGTDRNAGTINLVLRKPVTIQQLREAIAGLFPE